MTYLGTETTNKIAMAYYFCNICGGPIGKSEFFDGPTRSWLGKTFLLASRSDSDDDPLSSVLDVDTLDYGFFHIHQTQKDVIALNFRAYSRPTRLTLDNPFYIPCHRSCLFVAEKAISTSELDPLHRVLRTLNLRARSAKGESLAAPMPGLVLCPPGGWLGIYQYQDCQWVTDYGFAAEDLDVGTRLLIHFSRDLLTRVRSMNQIRAPSRTTPASSSRASSFYLYLLLQQGTYSPWMAWPGTCHHYLQKSSALL